MESVHHTVEDLFAQLGLASDANAIEAFLTTSRSNAMAEAMVWTPTQAAFLNEAVAADADWAIPAEWLFQALRR